jgi:hypothetical protein
MNFFILFFSQWVRTYVRTTPFYYATEEDTLEDRSLLSMLEEEFILDELYKLKIIIVSNIHVYLSTVHVSIKC